MVWSATRVDGGQPFTGKLPHPPQVDGTFQNFQVPGRRGPDGKIVVPPEYYGDATVIAYKIPEDDKTQSGAESANHRERGITPTSRRCPMAM